jgi:hypothetical protein
MMKQSRCAQEEEKRYRPGTNKYIAFQVLKAAGPRGLSVPAIMAASREAGWKEFDEAAKRVIQFVRASLPPLCMQFKNKSSFFKSRSLCMLLSPVYCSPPSTSTGGWQPPCAATA